MDGCLARTITKIEANPLLVRGKSDFRIVRVAAYCQYIPRVRYIFVHLRIFLFLDIMISKTDMEEL